MIYDEISLSSYFKSKYLNRFQKYWWNNFLQAQLVTQNDHSTNTAFRPLPSPGHPQSLECRINARVSSPEYLFDLLQQLLPPSTNDDRPRSQMCQKERGCPGGRKGLNKTSRALIAKFASELYWSQTIWTKI